MAKRREPFVKPTVVLDLIPEFGYWPNKSHVRSDPHPWGGILAVEPPLHFDDPWASEPHDAALVSLLEHSLFAGAEVPKTGASGQKASQDSSREAFEGELRSWLSAEIDRRFAEIRLELFGDEACEPDPMAQWMNDHPEELAKLRGLRIALHPTLGVVASGPDLRAVYDQVREKGLLDSVVFDAVPEL